MYVPKKHLLFNIVITHAVIKEYTFKEFKNLWKVKVMNNRNFGGSFGSVYRWRYYFSTLYITLPPSIFDWMVLGKFNSKLNCYNSNTKFVCNAPYMHIRKYAKYTYGSCDKIIWSSSKIPSLKTSSLAFHWHSFQVAISTFSLVTWALSLAFLFEMWYPKDPIYRWSDSIKRKHDFKVLVYHVDD